MKYTKELIAMLLNDQTTGNDFINQLRGTAVAASLELKGMNINVHSPFLENIKKQLDAEGCQYLLITENEFESGVCYTNTHDKDFKEKVNHFIEKRWK